MSHVSNKNIKLSRLSPLFKEKSSINDQVANQNPVSAPSEQHSGTQWEKGELRNLIIPKNLTRYFSRPIISSDTENMAHQSCNEVAPYSFPAHLSRDFRNLSPMTAEESEFWNPRSNKSDRRILESTEPELSKDRQKEMRVSRWQKIKKQFKKFKAALSCSSENSISEECSIATLRMPQITEPSSLLSTSIATMVSKPIFPQNKTDSTQGRSLTQNGEHPEIGTKEVADEKTENGDDILETQENTPKPAVAFKRSSAEISIEEMTSAMECSEPNFPSVSSIGKYWDNHPISRSCRNIFKANKPVWEETIIHRGRTSPWKVLKIQPVYEKQRKNKLLSSSKVMYSI